MKLMCALGHKFSNVVLIAALGLAGLFGGCAGASPTTNGTPAPPVLYDKDVGDAMVNHKPGKPIDPFYLAQPSGPFTKEEIFGLCAYIGIMVTAAVSAREMNDLPNRVMLDVLPAVTNIKSVALRDSKLSTQVLEYAAAEFEKGATLSPSEAKARQSGFPAGREFVEFNRSNIMNCYATLGSWR